MNREMLNCETLICETLNREMLNCETLECET